MAETSTRRRSSSAMPYGQVRTRSASDASAHFLEIPIEVSSEEPLHRRSSKFHFDSFDNKNLIAVNKDEITAQSLTVAEGPRSIDDFLDEVYEKSTNRMRYWFVIITLGIANLGDAAELSGMGYLISNNDFQDEILHHDMAHKGAVVASVALAGMITGGIIAGSFEQSLGRKPTMLLGLMVNAVSCFASAFSPGVLHLSILRFVAGIGIGAISASLTSLTSELSPPSRRGFLVTVVSGFWSFGMLYVALAAYIVMGRCGLSWRVYVGFTVVPTIISMSMVWAFVPESARYLGMQGHYSQAASSANAIAETLGYRGQKLHADEIRYFYNESIDDESGEESTLCQTLSNLSVLYSKQLWGRTISLQFLWICLEMGSGLGGFINLIFVEAHASPYAGTFMSAIGNLIGSVLGAIILDRSGRKPMVLCSLSASSFAMLSFAWIVHEDSKRSVQLSLSVLLFNALVSITWSANVVMTSELFPTKCRNTAFGFIAATGRFACIIEQFINGALVGHPSALLSVASGILMFGAVTMLAMKTEDMTGQPLADVIGGEKISNEKKSVIEIIKVDADSKEEV